MSDFKISGAYVEFGEKGLGKLKGDISGLKAALGGLGMGQLVGGVAGGQLVAGGVRSLFSGIASGLATVARQAVGGAAQFETYNEQWRTLLGNMGDAQAMMGRLAQFADTTPFQLDEVVVAAQRLQVFGGAALNTQDNLRLIGDAAAATGSSFQEVAFWVSRAYSMMKEGQPFGEAALRLQELGIMTGRTRKEVESLSRLFPGDQRVFKTFMDSLKPFSGGMERMSHTLSGKVSTMADAWKRVTREVGNAFLPTLKKATDRVTDLFNRLSANKGQWSGLTSRLEGAFDRLFDAVASPQRLNELADSLSASIANVFKSNTVTEAIAKFGAEIGIQIAKNIALAAARGMAPFGGLIQQGGIAGPAINRMNAPKAGMAPPGFRDIIEQEIAKAGGGGGGGQGNANDRLARMVMQDKQFLRLLQEEKDAWLDRDNARNQPEWFQRGKVALWMEARNRLKQRAQFLIDNEGAEPEDGPLTKMLRRREALQNILEGRKDSIVENVAKQRLAIWQRSRNEPPRFLGLEEMWKSIQVAAGSKGESINELLKEQIKELVEGNKIAHQVEDAMKKLAQGGLLRFAN